MSQKKLKIPNRHDFLWGMLGPLVIALGTSHIIHHTSLEDFYHEDNLRMELDNESAGRQSWPQLTMGWKLPSTPKRGRQNHARRCPQRNRHHAAVAFAADRHSARSIAGCKQGEDVRLQKMKKGDWISHIELRCIQDESANECISSQTHTWFHWPETEESDREWRSITWRL